MQRALATAIFGIIVVSSRLPAQYFGQNRVQHRHLDFSIIETEHFDVYYYDGEERAAIDGARMAERSYARLSRILNHRYRERQPLILFASHSEFQQNNVTPIGEGTMGVTEPFRHRVLLPFTGSYAEFEHVLQHEIVHQFQFDIFAGSTIGAGLQRLIATNPPLWFMEGMAEYISIGPVDAQTEMWLRDAVLHETLPTIDDLTHDPRHSPYRFGHALFSYVGERWGDDAIARILHGAAATSVESAFIRAVGRSFDELTADWHDALKDRYQEAVGSAQAPHTFAQPVLTRAQSSGKWHLSPALSPDGSSIVYLSEGKSFWIDLYLADAKSGKPERRLVKGAFSSEFESLRFLNSTGAWSPDGRLFAFAAKHGGGDDLVIFDIGRKKVVNRIRVPLHGVTSPSWSPDGTQLVFTGYDGGLSDLFVIGTDGEHLRRLTNDRFADLHPTWSPDGNSVAFATDRGPSADFSTLKLSALQIALYDLQSGAVTLLDGMHGQNISPQWAPDGQSVAFVSDRTGVPNVFLYDVDERVVYQLTNVQTGVAGVTPLSPAITWAQRSDRLAFSYYERGEFNVYAIDDPRSKKRRSNYIAESPNGANGDDTTENGHHGTPPFVDRTLPRPLSVRRLLDSVSLALPDSSELRFRDYSAKFTPDYVVQPSIGYVRGTYGSGFYGGTAVSLSDMLGNHRVLFATQINGRFDEALVVATYASLGRRINWIVGLSQQPAFYYTSSETAVETNGEGRLVVNLDRFVTRQIFLQTYRPFNKLTRAEFGIRAANVSHAQVSLVQEFDAVSGYVFRTDRVQKSLGHSNYAQPVIALVFDNTVHLWSGPFVGKRSRFEYAPAFGNWKFHQFLADYRRYDRITGFVTVASRLLFFGRFGRDNEQFPVVLGAPELVRGYTSASFRRQECSARVTGDLTTCGALDQLVGSRLAVANLELRFPMFSNRGLGPAAFGLLPLEGGLFLDAGMTWRDGNTIVLGRNIEQRADKARYRTPLVSWGVSLRSSLLGMAMMQATFAFPVSRETQGAYWTLSLGPTF